MSDILGLAAFGLGDVCVGGKTVQGPARLPASVILPHSWRGTFLAGEAAAESRLENGLQWPPEAGISTDTILRRVPVGLLWSKLVQDGGKSSSWTPSEGARCATATALHAHVASLLTRAEWNGQELVVAIPNALDEVGQEDLLRAFGKARPRVQLIWRPVAAALEWLHTLGPDFHIAPDDWMLVLYLGPDLFEATAFTLQQDETTGWPVPVRSRRRKGPGLTGMDWAWSCCPGTTPGEIWQQVTRFPEVWESLTLRQSVHGSRQLWNREGGTWDIWEADRSLRAWQTAKAQESTWLSNQLDRRHAAAYPSWNSCFLSLIQDAAEQYSKGRLRGVILCGPLVPRKRPDWINAFRHAKTMQISRTPMPDTIWLPTSTDDSIIARGAQRYGERLRDNLPTYLDTLPELRIMTQDRRRHLVWKSLVDATTCKGGQEYINVLHGFSYQKSHSSLAALLAREYETHYRREEVPLPFVPEKDIPIDIWVRMKPASGLAQVRLVTHDNSVEELLFDFSRMQEVSELPKEELFCPDDGHIQLSDILDNSDQNAIITNCLDFIASPVDDTALNIYYEKLRKKWLMPSRPLKIIDENGMTQTCFEQELIRVQQRLAAIRETADHLHPRLARLASFLWGKTPDTFRKDIAQAIRRSAGWRIPKEYIETAGRCFQTEDECRLLFRYIVNENLQYAYALTAVFHLLHYRPAACNALDDRTAYGLLEMALTMMEQQRREKKVKFRNAASLLFVLLKYRLQHARMSFLGPKDEYASRLHVRQRLQNYIEELDEALSSSLHISLPLRTRKNLETSRQYIKDILLYIDYRGDPSAVPLMDDEE